MDKLAHIRIVLVEPSHPGNIGAVARAMKNMGLTRLYLVNPVAFPHHEATVRAAGADELLENAVICADLHEALADCQLIFATSARSRHLPWPEKTPWEMAQAAVNAQPQEIAIVFGRERFGLKNTELDLAHFHVIIPTNPNFSSLNLAQAVQVMVYEIFQAALGEDKQTQRKQPAAITHQEYQSLYDHFEKTLSAIGFLNQAHPKLLARRLKRFLSRARVQQEEFNILQGILSTVDKRMQIGIIKTTLNQEKDIREESNE